MKPTRPQDASSLALIATAAIALAVAHNVHRLTAARALPNLILTHPLIAAAVLLAAADVIAARMVATRPNAADPRV